MIGARLRPNPAAALTVAGQTLSSAANMVLQLGLVVTLAPDRYGKLVVAFAGYYLALAVGRAVVGDPLVAYSAQLDLSSMRLVAVFGAAAAVPALLLAGLDRGPDTVGLVAFGVSLPVLLVQDASRYGAWATARPGAVVVMDGLWLAATTAGLLVAQAGPFESAAVPPVLAAWLGGGWLSAFVGFGRCASGRTDPAAGQPTASQPTASPAGEVSEGEGNRRRDGAPAQALAHGQLLLAADANGLPVAVSVVADAAAAGLVRASQLPFLPLATVLGAMRILYLPRVRAAGDQGRGAVSVLAFSALFTVVGATAALAVLAGFAVVPESWLGETGQAVKPLLGAAAIVMATRMISLVPSDATAMFRGSQAVIRRRLLTSGLDWTVMLVVLGLAGVGPALWARAATGCIGLMVWLAPFVGRGRTPGSPRPEPTIDSWSIVPPPDPSPTRPAPISSRTSTAG